MVRSILSILYSDSTRSSIVMLPRNGRKDEIWGFSRENDREGSVTDCYALRCIRESLVTGAAD